MPSLIFYSSSYASLSLADAAASGAGGTLTIDSNVTLSGALTLTSKQITFAGGIITLGTYDLTFNGNVIVAGGTQIFNSTGSGKVKGNITGDICFDWWGTTSTSIANSATSDAMNDCLAYVVQSANRNATVHATKAHYYLSQTIVKSESVFCPRIYGHGATLHYDFFDAAAFYIKGGSGAVSNGLITDFIFEATHTSLGIEVDGQDGVDIMRCTFDTLAWGIVCHNKSTGAFTEYVQWESCHFTQNCKGAWWFRISEGHQSFHGCGPRANVLVNDPENRLDPNILLDNGAIVYNAPCNFQIWTRNTKATIKAGTNCFFYVHGTVTYEAFSGTPTVMEALSSNQTLVGGFLGWGATPRYGSVIPMHDMGLAGSGVVYGFQKPRNLPEVMLPAGGGTVVLPRYRNADFIIDVLLKAPNYTFKCFLKLGLDPYGNASCVTLATEQAFNVAGYGAPTFSYDGSNLSIANPSYPANTVEAIVSMVDVGGPK